ncbi:hypothetical protein ADUPG1_012784 [Aduncisulcus paluster]|uniref:Uncharacterized protein n=1 Tax=Aduncisulcus paluster TaxID=2918883 RepID=A0ABQ5K0N1_9EUKA|nr:hypothetical protein ADUPG1_012784 [Aduncisulcus paluster]|eukprot:gnl/Carplike_NY0171/547_a749_2606.p1 GENE.gnl/Carplike_NY0171/547_a749_2606~~gnl/Carplike_NY0171/547_a749_2606.p1  ORF type:complete len:338 (+),score=96.08 gnl/Carplike_NY0171/547_a749_2606:48-1016(+)
MSGIGSIFAKVRPGFSVSAEKTIKSDLFVSKTSLNTQFHGKKVVSSVNEQLISAVPNVQMHLNGNITRTTSFDDDARSSSIDEADGRLTLIGTQQLKGLRGFIHVNSGAPTEPDFGLAFTGKCGTTASYSSKKGIVDVSAHPKPIHGVKISAFTRIPLHKCVSHTHSFLSSKFQKKTEETVDDATTSKPCCVGLLKKHTLSTLDGITAVAEYSHPRCPVSTCLLLEGYHGIGAQVFGKLSKSVEVGAEFKSSYVDFVDNLEYTCGLKYTPDEKTAVSLTTSQSTTTIEASHLIAKGTRLSVSAAHNMDSGKGSVGVGLGLIL